MYHIDSDVEIVSPFIYVPLVFTLSPHSEDAWA